MLGSKSMWVITGRAKRAIGAGLFAVLEQEHKHQGDRVVCTVLVLRAIPKSSSVRPEDITSKERLVQERISALPAKATKPKLVGPTLARSPCPY